MEVVVFPADEFALDPGCGDRLIFEIFHDVVFSDPEIFVFALLVVLSIVELFVDKLLDYLYGYLVLPRRLRWRELFLRLSFFEGD